MKKLITNIAMIACISLLGVSCDYDETEYQSLLNEYDASSTYYLQFAEPEMELKGAEGDTLTADVQVKLLGPPQSEAITIDFAPDASSTLTANMYELSSTTLVIPAGESASNIITITTNPGEMPLDENLSLIFQLSEGEHNATAGTTLNYTFLQQGFCPLEGPSDLVGGYSVLENTSEWENAISVSLEADQYIVSDLAKDIIQEGWQEAIIEGGTFVMEVDAETGTINIPRQYIFTTEWNGNPYRYEVEGSGEWTNCTDTPQIILEYDIYYEGDPVGSGLGVSYFGVPNFGGVFSKN